MKKIILSVCAVMSVGSTSFAQLCGGKAQPGQSCASRLTSITPFTLVSESKETTSDSLQNDSLMVQGDAIIALETGVISSELKSVVDRIRAESSEDMTHASDLEVVETIFGGI